MRRGGGRAFDDHHRLHGLGAGATPARARATAAQAFRACGRACESDRLGHERGRRGDEAEGDDDLHVLVVCVRDGSL